MRAHPASVGARRDARGAGTRSSSSQRKTRTGSTSCSGAQRALRTSDVSAVVTARTRPRSGAGGRGAAHGTRTGESGLRGAALAVAASNCASAFARGTLEISSRLVPRLATYIEPPNVPRNRSSSDLSAWLHRESDGSYAPRRTVDDGTLGDATPGRIGIAEAPATLVSQHDAGTPRAGTPPPRRCGSPDRRARR